MNPSIDLEAAQAAFLASGGSIIVLDGFQYVPPRPHRDIEVIRAAPEKSEDPRLARKLSQISEIRRLAKTMTSQQVHEATGYSRQTLFRLAREGNFVYRRAERKPRDGDKREAQRQIQRNQKRIDELKLVERICALRDVGLNRNQVAKQIGISYGALTNIVERNQVDFPRVFVKK
ncbi:hypothetical protein CCOS865_02181 [Pseudomonas reidholzensis]|uniref:Uncharacterized protein n=1 Tax=Pseudomonas reidholzensis TaxID=1785162 RepID=A0A383RSR0_9PSED|nr:hypothetical protein [Pseudomonas reidholzensis]SYX89915.1 hypothetical protein CCOS865_02181 [Pseudomonas reidholzensis]